jgi:hypothetical protein
MHRAFATLIPSVAGLCLLAGCPDGGHDNHHHDYDRRADYERHTTVERREDYRGGGGNYDRRDDWHDRDAQGWELIARRSADDKRDSDSFDVGRGEGRFSKIKLQVRGGELVMYKMVVQFKDGSRITPKLDHHFSNKESSRTIDLPGDRRVIERVVLNYRAVRGKPEVYVYAR